MPDDDRAAQVRHIAPCPTCHGTDFWTSTYGVLVCRKCHPPAPGAEK